MDDQTVNDVIRKRRETMGLSVREAASRAKVSEGRLRQIEKGYAVAAAGMHVPVRPSDRTLRMIAGALDLDGEELVALWAKQVTTVARPDAREDAHAAFAALVRGDTTLDAESRDHIIHQHYLLQKGSTPPLTSEDLDIISEKKLDAAKAIKDARKKRQTPGAASE